MCIRDRIVCENQKEYETYASQLTEKFPSMRITDESDSLHKYRFHVDIRNISVEEYFHVLFLLSIIRKSDSWNSLTSLNLASAKDFLDTYGNKNRK